jgi:hypothetical protein
VDAAADKTANHKTETLMAGVKEKPKGRNHRDKQRSKKKYYSQAYAVNNMKNWKK